MDDIPSQLELTWLLACCALNPELDGILLLDLPAWALPEVSQRFARFLGQLGEGAVAARVVAVGSREEEEDLWDALRVVPTSAGVTFAPAAGRLVPRTAHEQLVVTIADLSQVSVAVARAASMTLGAPDGRLQRHGLAITWPRSSYWLAACPSADVGKISPHLLDRFSVRFPAAKSVRAEDPVLRMHAALDDTSYTPELQLPDPPMTWVTRARGTRTPVPTEDAIAHALAVHDARHGTRRPLALLRLAAASARLMGHESVDAELVADVARRIAAEASQPSSAIPVSPSGTDSPEPPVAPQGIDNEPETDAHPGQPVEDPTGAAQPGVVPAVVSQGDEPLLLDAVSTGVVVSTAYPEDEVESEHEAHPLQLPWQRRADSHHARGLAVGTTAARDLNDVAWVETLRHASLYQAFRQPSGAVHGAPLRVLGADIRQYRRAPQPEGLALFVIDHTCVSDNWDWMAELAPHLQAAYVARAAICLVEVGAAGGRSPLRADRTSARSLLDPRVDAALNREALAATPLAHGLELAHDRLQHALHHEGGRRATHADVVVLTDGLGNVPLAASQANELSQPVRSGGVDDALEAAAGIGALDGVRVALISPPDAPYPDVLAQLYVALGCTERVEVG